jgi:predicted O-linked N-acetylglucosamine transferase (SPINDLY family)
MGVPIITAPGTRSISRSTASILATLGLSDWIAASPEDYVRLAVRYAEDRETLAELRRTLRGRMRASPLMDELRFAHDVEDAYRRMWRVWCENDAK